MEYTIGTIETKKQSREWKPGDLLRHRDSGRHVFMVIDNEHGRLALEHDSGAEKTYAVDLINGEVVHFYSNASSDLIIHMRAREPIVFVPVVD